MVERYVSGAAGPQPVYPVLTICVVSSVKPLRRARMVASTSQTSSTIVSAAPATRSSRPWRPPSSSTSPAAAMASSVFPCSLIPQRLQLSITLPIDRYRPVCPVPLLSSLRLFLAPSHIASRLYYFCCSLCRTCMRHSLHITCCVAVVPTWFLSPKT